MSMQDTEVAMNRVSLDSSAGTEAKEGGGSNRDRGNHDFRGDDATGVDNEDHDTLAVSPEMIIKHPLQSSWTLWFFKTDKSKAWEDQQNRIITFNTVEDFWALYHHIEKASKITNGCDYSLFKEGIKPMWEDKMNCRGGKWNIELEKKHRSQYLDNFWLEIMLCLIGEFFEDYSPYVNGAVVALRAKHDKIGLWLSESKASEAVNVIGKRLKDHLCIDPTVSLLFLTHEVSRARPGSSIKGSYKV